MTQTPLLDATIEAEAASFGLLVGEGSKLLIAELKKIAAECSCELVSGASPAGNQLAGALIYASQGKLRPWTPNASGDILVVDGIVVGDSGLQSYMALLGRMSTSRVHGVALAASHKVFSSSPNIHLLSTESLIGSVA